MLHKWLELTTRKDLPPVQAAAEGSRRRCRQVPTARPRQNVTAGSGGSVVAGIMDLETGAGQIQPKTRSVGGARKRIV